MRRTRQTLVISVVLALLALSSTATGSASTDGSAYRAAAATAVTRAAANAPANAWAKRTWGYLAAPGGVKLRYSVLLPKAHGRFPVLMQYDGYDAGEIGGSAYQQGNTWMSSELDASLLRHGYAIVGLQMPGTGCSSGTFNLFSKAWATDGALGVRWAARQSWATGHVGMYDWSWPGIGQLFTASARPRGLDAIAPGMVVTDPLRDVGSLGGVVEPGFAALWWVTIQDSWTYAAEDAASDGDSRCATNLAANLSNGQLHSPITAFTHQYEDAYWAVRNLRARTRRIDVPVLSMTDWQDEEVGARGGYYQRLLNPRRTWTVGTNGQHDIYLSLHFRRTLIAFLDHFVKGEPNGFGRSPHVRLWEETTSTGGAQSSDAQLTHAKPGFVITRPSLPVPVTAERLYLRPGGLLGRTRPAAAARDRRVRPEVGPMVNDDLASAVTGSSGGKDGELPWTTSKPAVGEALSFTTPRLTRAITVSGPASLNLWVASSARDTNLQATVTEVRPNGQEEYVQRGWLRVSQRAIDRSLSSPLLPVHKQTAAASQPLTPGRMVRARLEILSFTHTFRPGTALRIWIDAPSGTGDWTFLPSDLGETDTIGTSRAHPSVLVLGRLSGHQAPGREPACNLLVGEPCRHSSVRVVRRPGELLPGW